MKRFNVISGTALTGAGAEIYEDPEGRFVRYLDVVALEAELAAARTQISALNDEKNNRLMQAHPQLETFSEMTHWKRRAFAAEGELMVAQAHARLVGCEDVASTAIALETERTMHTAWRKRGEEAEAELAEAREVARNLRCAAEQVCNSLKLTPGGDALNYIGSTNDRDTLGDAIDAAIEAEFAAIDAAMARNTEGGA